MCVCVHSYRSPPSFRFSFPVPIVERPGDSTVVLRFHWRRTASSHRSNGMAMKWLRTAKPSVHSSRSLTALDEPLACERGTESMNAVQGKQARRLTRPMRSGGRDAAWCAHFERWYERWPLEEEDMRCESMYFYCVHEVVHDDDDVLTMRFLQRSTRRKQS